MIIVACVALAACLVVGWGGQSLNAQRRLATEPAPHDHHPERLLFLPILVAGISVAAIRPQALPVIVMGGSIVTTALWLARRVRSRQVADRREREVKHGCMVIASQLRVGKIPAVALQAAAAESPLLASVQATQTVGGQVPAAFRAVAAQPGAAGLTEVARAWELCERTGAPVAPAVARIVERMRSDEASRRTVSTELATARSTGRLLACLPVVGLLFGFVAGGDPVKFLIATAAGRICLAAAILLACLGLFWTEKLADGVERSMDAHRLVDGEQP